LVDESPQGTVFCNHKYLSSLESNFELFEITKGRETKAGLCLILNKDRSSAQLDDLVIYNGLLFNQNKSQKDTKARYERFKMTEFVIQHIVEKFGDINLSLSPFFEDIRPFLWHNYHAANGHKKFKVDVRYTSLLNIEELRFDKSEEGYALFKNMDTLRQRNLREARKRKDIRVSPGTNISLFIEYYRLLMAKQGIEVSTKKLSKMKGLTKKLLEKNMAVFTAAHNEEGEILYITVFCFDKKRAYYLFGAGNPSSKERFQGTVTFWDTFKILAQQYGIKEIDMEGVNSPKRGWFKLSFGGYLMPYYHLRYTNH
jgi:hypothetical protein